MGENAIEKAINIFGTDVEFAKIIQVTPQAIGKWKKSQVPANRCRAIEELTSGQVTRYDLRPDIFGERCKKVA